MGCYTTAFNRMLPLHRRTAALALRVAHGVARRSAAIGGEPLRRAIVRAGDRVVGGVARGPTNETDGATVDTRFTAAAAAIVPARDLVVSVIGSLAPGGAERQLSLYLAGATRRGLARHELVTLNACTGVHAHHLPRLAAQRVPVRAMGAEADPEVIAILRTDRALRERLEALPAAFRSDAVELACEFLRARPRTVHAWLDHANVTAGLAALAVGVPEIVLSLRSLHPANFPVLHRAWMRPWYRFLVADPRVRLVANSHAGAASYAEWLGIDAARIAVVLNGVDGEDLKRPDPAKVAALRAALGVGERDLLVAGILRLSEEKRPQLFVRLAREITAANPRVRFALAGDGMLRDEIRALAAPLGERLALLGARNDAETVLAAADAVLLTSRVEGTPNVLLEAQHLGVPVVATRVGGVADAVDDGRTGILCDADDEGALRDALERLLADDALRARLGAAGPAWVAERFSVDAMVDGTHALYGANAR